MLCKLSSFSLFALALSSVVSARPVVNRSYGVPAPITPRASIPVTLGGKQIGSNQRGGNFDDFFGSGNFDANLNEVTIVKQQKQLVCSSNDLRRVRQQLAVIQEFAKQIILQQVCEVEIQTVIIQQLNVQIDNFGRNVRRSGGSNGKRNNGPSFDVVVAQKITEITQVISRGGNLGDLDLGFLGSDIGRNSAQVGGSNWDDNKSPESVGNAYKAAKDEQKKEQDAGKNQQGNDGKKQQEQKTTTASAGTATATATKAATASTSSAAAEKTAESKASATSTKASAAESSTAAQASATESSKAAEASATKSSKAAESSATESSAAATPTPTKARK